MLILPLIKGGPRELLIFPLVKGGPEGVVKIIHNFTMKVQYKNYLKNYSRTLRNNPTQSEKILWQHIKGRQLKGFQFSRQKPMGNFIADFYCYKLKLVIELDGASHYGNEKKIWKNKAILNHLALLF